MGLILVTAIGPFALHHVPESWPRPAVALAICVNAMSLLAFRLVSIAVVLNLVATVIALARTGRMRAIGAGYAVGGWIYFPRSLDFTWLTNPSDAITSKYWIPLNQAHQFFPFSDDLEFVKYRLVAHGLSAIAAGVAGGLVARKLCLQSSPTPAIDF